MIPRAGVDYLFEPPGNFSARGAHPEERPPEANPPLAESDEGSLEILPRFARQDEGSNIKKNSPTPHLFQHNPYRTVVGPHDFF